jgi:hypothetical protein
MVQYKPAILPSNKQTPNLGGWVKEEKISDPFSLTTQIAILVFNPPLEI